MVLNSGAIQHVYIISVSLLYFYRLLAILEMELKNPFYLV